MAKQKSAARTVGTPALVALADAGVEHAARAYEHDPRRKLGHGLEAAAALGVEPARVFKTLVTTIDATLTVAVVPVTTTVGALVVLSVALTASWAWATDNVAHAPATAIVIRRRWTGSLENVFKFRCILSPYCIEKPGGATSTGYRLNLVHCCDKFGNFRIGETLPLVN